ncbi:MAG: hypothetical protein KGL53_09090, partial [Elusimicrobia bacterium]|nr:hypothetical protein [Elusimicrobiota bacterium]
MSALALLAAVLAFPAAAQEVPYTPPDRAYTCMLEPGWTAFEQATLEGPVDHIVGPEGPAGWRPEFHIHLMEKGKPGWLEPRELLKALRRSDSSSHRTATALSSWRVARKPAR